MKVLPGVKWSIAAIIWFYARNVGMDPWQFSVFENYYIRAYPEIHRFKYMLTDADSGVDGPARSVLPDCDYLLFSRPADDCGKTWETILYYRFSGTRVIRNKGLYC